MDITRRRLLMLLPAAAVAWKYVQAGAPEAAPNYKMTEHWWAMLIEIPKCIGCGSCVRACAEENDVPEGYYRTWIERYHVADWRIEKPDVESPNGGKQGFPLKKSAERTSSFQALQPLRGLPLHPGLSRRRDFCYARWGRPSRQDLLPRLPLLRAGVSLRVPIHQSQDKYSGEMLALLSPHHQGPDDRMLRGLPNRRASARRPEESEGPDS